MRTWRKEVDCRSIGHRDIDNGNFTQLVVVCGGGCVDERRSTGIRSNEVCLSLFLEFEGSSDTGECFFRKYPKA
jgi:hypothetical protein